MLNVTHITPVLVLLSVVPVLDLDFCKVPPQLCDGSTLIHHICNSSSSSGGVVMQQCMIRNHLIFTTEQTPTKYLNGRKYAAYNKHLYGHKFAAYNKQF